MRMHALVIAMAVATTLAAQPAWAHHKPNHSDFFSRTGAPVQIMRDPCGVSHNPHQPPGADALGDRCRRLLAQYRASPNDPALRDRCDRAARARTGRTCSELVEHQQR